MDPNSTPSSERTSEAVEVSKALHWALGLAAGHVQMGDAGYEHACAVLERVDAALQHPAASSEAPSDSDNSFVPPASLPMGQKPRTATEVMSGMAEGEDRGVRTIAADSPPQPSEAPTADQQDDWAKPLLREHIEYEGVFHGKYLLNPDGPAAVAKLRGAIDALEAIRKILAGYAGQPTHMGDIYKIADAGLAGVRK